MADTQLVSIVGRPVSKSNKNCKVFLIKPPYFTPWTPPLGIAILKTYLQQHGYTAQCVDFNVDPELWGMHHKYFTILRSLEDVSINDGYSKLWWIINAHMLAYVNTNGNNAACTRVLETVVPLYGISIEPKVIEALLPLVEKFFRRLDYLVDHSNLADYSVVGTSTYTTSLASSLFILKKLKQQYPHIRTVMGGGVFADDLALGSDNLDTLIREYDYVDNIILGEGELLLLKVLNGDFSGKRVVSIKDLGQSTLGMKDVPIPDFTDLNLEDYYHLTIEGARSCPFQCSFCSETIQWGDYRKKPIDQFADQVITLSQQYQNNSFFMGDSLMNPYINPFASTLIERKANVLYDGYLRADKPVTNRKFVKLWADSGCYRVRLGIESAATNVLNSMDKMTTPKVISDVLKTLANGGIRTTTYWIVGFAGETESDFQETLDFVREHHRYIYELEAHPYYYYPYGQVGSRLHQCYSLYPDEIIDIIKFKVWEIVDSNPTREERYDRLRRFSALASELQLPNIYTMAERYQAEDRWHALYPLAAKVYEGTGFRNEKVRLPREAVTVFAEANAENVLCYRVAVSKRLDEATLSKALDRLIESQQLLQMRLQDGKYTATNNAQSNESLLVSCEVQPESSETLETLRSEIIEKLANEMRPERRSSIRAALFHVEEESSELVLLLHRGIGDGKSLALLFESLFRIYEQMSNSVAVSLRPVPKSYADFIRELKTKGNAPVVFSANGHGSVSSTNAVSQTHSQNVSIDRSIVTRMAGKALREFDLKPAEVFTIAALRSLAKAGIETAIDATVDYRTLFDDLTLTVGPLTRVSRLPEGLSSDEELSSSSIRELLQTLRQAPVNSLRNTESSDDAHERLLLNLEYFTEEPWLGGDQWQPQGFTVTKDSLRSGYAFEVMPLQTNGALETHLIYRDAPHTSQLVKAVAENLTGEVEAIVEYCERYFNAKEFWLEELGKKALNPEVSASNGNGHRQQGSIACGIDEQSLSELAAECETDQSVVLLAAYTVLLSRLHGREKIVLAASIAEDEKINFVPLRLNPAWKLTFKEFVDQVRRKISLASKHTLAPFDVIAGDIFAANQSALSSALGFGYVFRKSSADNDYTYKPRELSRLIGLELTLNVLQSDHGLSLHLDFDREQFKEASMESISAHLSSILEQVYADANRQLQAIVFKRKYAHINPSENLAAEAFHF